MTMMPMEDQSNVGSVSMSTMINYASLKIYTDFQKLTEVIRYHGDSERKTEIVNFLSASRSLLIRIQALNKWTTSANKVEKCTKILQLLQEQSSFLIQTALDLSFLATNKLPYARLPNSMPIIAADIFATRTYSRLPNHIRLSVLQTKPISKTDKSRMFNELNRILRIRLSNSKIPHRMRNIIIEYGRVTFKVENEFEVTCTLMSDHFDHPWRILNIVFLVNGNSICRGRSLIHKNHLKDIHRQVQSRMQISHNEQYPSLFHLYDMLHSMSIGMQLEVLHEQLIHYIQFSHGLQIDNITYDRSFKLSFVYWKISEKYPNRQPHIISIVVDDDDSRRPLKVKHLPTFISNEYTSEYILDSNNLSITNIIFYTIKTRMYSSLKIIERILSPFILNNYTMTDEDLSLKIPILQNTPTENYLRIYVNRSNGLIDCNFDIKINFLPLSDRARFYNIVQLFINTLNELYVKIFNFPDNCILKNLVSESLENKEIIRLRRQISECLMKLRVFMSAYKCYYTLQQARFKNLEYISNKPTFVKPTNKDELYYQILESANKNECELIYIPLNLECQFYLLIVCEIEHRFNPVYRIYDMKVMKVYSTSPDNSYNQKSWIMKPISLNPFSNDLVQRILHYMPLEPCENEVWKRSESKSSSILSCHDLLSKRMKLNSGDCTINEAYIKEMKRKESQYHIDIENLPVIISYLRKNLSFKLLVYEMDKRLFSTKYLMLDDNMSMLSCSIESFPTITSCSTRTCNLMNKLLKSCIISYFDTHPSDDHSSNVGWEIEMKLNSPMLAIRNWLDDPNIKLKPLTIIKYSESTHNISQSVEKLINLWDRMCKFCDWCLAPLVKQKTVSTFKVKHFDFNSIYLTYGPNNEYGLHISQNNPNSLKNDELKQLKVMVTIDQPDPKLHRTNPHQFVQDYIELDLNKTKNILSIIKTMSQCENFLPMFIKFNEPKFIGVATCPDQSTTPTTATTTIQSTSTSNPSTSTTTQPNTNPPTTNIAPISSTTITNLNTHIELVRQYIILYIDMFQVQFIYRQRFVISISFNPQLNEINMEDGFENFHACNMSIQKLPCFDIFLKKLKAVYSKINVDIFSEFLNGKQNILLSYLESAVKLEGRESLEIQFNALQNPVQAPSQNASQSNLSSERFIRIWMEGPKEPVLVDNLLWTLDMEIKNVSQSPDTWLINNEAFVKLIKEFFDKKIKNENSLFGLSRIQVFKKLLQLPSLRLQKNLLSILTKEPAVIKRKPEEEHSYQINVDLDWSCHDGEPIICQKQDISSIYLKFYVCVKQVGIDSASHIKLWYLPMHYAAKSNDISLLEGTDPAIMNMKIDIDANQLYLVADDDADTPIPTFFTNLASKVAHLI